MLEIEFSCLNLIKLFPVCLPYTITDLSSDPVALNYFPSDTAVIAFLCPLRVYNSWPFFCYILAVMSLDPVSTLNSSAATDITSSLCPD